jgi:hypothetical protein
MLLVDAIVESDDGVGVDERRYLVDMPANGHGE